MLYIALACLLLFQEPKADEKPWIYTERGEITGKGEMKTIEGWAEQVQKARSEDNRNHAARVLDSISEAHAKKPHPDSERALLARHVRACLKSAKESPIQYTLLAAAVRIKDKSLLPEVKPFASDGAMAEKAVAVYVAVGDEESAKDLVAVVQNTRANRSARVAAAKAIGSFGGKDAFKALEKLHESEKSADVKEAIAKSLDAIEKRIPNVAAKKAA